MNPADSTCTLSTGRRCSPQTASAAHIPGQHRSGPSSIQDRLVSRKDQSMPGQRGKRLYRVLVPALVVLSTIFLVSCTNSTASTTPASAAGTIVEFRLPTRGSPEAITAGPDGNLWFTEKVGNRIGRITPQGQISEFPLPTSNSFPAEIVSGPDGNLWFTESSSNQIGRITPQGQISEFPLMTTPSLADGLAKGPDGALWFTDSATGNIGRVTPGGTATEFPLLTSDTL